MADLARKERVRGGHKASVTKIVHKAEELPTTESPDVARLAQIRMSLQEKLTVLKVLDADVFELIETEDSVMDEVEQSDVFKQDVYAVLVRIEQISPRSSTYAASELSSLTPRSDLSSGVASKVRRPELTIQPFSGEPTYWMTFWDSYRGVAVT